MADVRTPELVINKLSKQQYENIQNPSDTEFYLVPEDEEHKPICYPTTASEVTTTSMVVKSSVSDNGKILTENGFVYNTSGNPTVSDTKVVCDLGVGWMEKKLENLTRNTEYHIKSYGQNASGLVYGSELVQRTNNYNLPSDYPEYLQLWLRADSVELTDGKVSRWYDLSPNQYEFVQTNASTMPAFIENVLNGKPVLDFRLQDFLSGSNILDFGPNSWTWIIVWKTVSNGELVCKTKLSNSPGRWEFQSDHIWWHTSAGQQSVPFTTGNDFNIISWESDRTLEEHRISSGNNLLNRNAINAPEYNLAYNCNVIIGGFDAGNENIGTTARFAGQIAEIIAFNTVDETMRDSISQYLIDRYNIPIS